MKKYIGLIIYLIAIILLSYIFFFIAKKNSSNNETVSQTTIQTGTLSDINKEEENTFTEIEKNDIKSEELNNETENKVPEYIVVGGVQFVLDNTSNYNDIFDIMGVDSSIPKYKFINKDIYIKELNSIDYETKKSNVERLIQKIGGNIKETNLFGDKQLFVNPDVYYTKTSIMLVEYNGKVYMLVFPYDKYEEYKAIFKDILFVK